MNIAYITDAQAQSALTYPEVTAALAVAYADLAHGQAAILPRQRCSAGSGAGAAKFASMGALWAAKGIAATKSYPTVNGQFSFLINLFDTLANQPLAVMQAQTITRFRTACQTAMVVQQLQLGPRVRKVALFGAGQQGVAQIEALSHVLGFDELAIVAREAGDAAKPIPSFDLAAKCEGVRISRMSAEQAVRGAQVVITATKSQQSVLKGEWLDANAFVAAVGVSTAAGRELDDACFDRADRVIVEWLPQSMQEAGDVLAWLKASPSGQTKVSDFVALGQSAWPSLISSPPGITVYKSVGTGLADAACAQLVWQKFKP
jgi:ornithine cyclodeaminase